MKGVYNVMQSLTKETKKILMKAKRKKKHEIVQFSRINWDSEFYYDITRGNGFIITEPANISLDGFKEKSLYGPQSPLYGDAYENEYAYSMRFRCECGEFRSRQFEGEICPKCHTEIKERGENIKMTGWIYFGEDNHLINPYYYQLLEKAIGKEVFNDIVKSKIRVTKDGKQEKLTLDEYETAPSSIWAGIGIDSFYEQYETIIKHFMGIKKNKKDDLNYLLNSKYKVFTHCSPIYSTMLRPQSITSDTFYFGSLDKIINTLFTLSENIKNCMDIERDLVLFRIQEKLLKMWNVSFELLKGKEGWIRGEILGGSLNFSSRNVIICGSTLRDNEVDLSYNTFLQLFKYKIIYYIKEIRGINLSKAAAIWKNAFKFDPFVYDIMCHINEKEDPRLLINRNPTLNYYSMVMVKIRKIKHYASEYCLTVPLSLLPGMNADFDGDILNICGLIEPMFVYMFRKFDPIDRMMIDRSTGLLNKSLSLDKNQKIDMYYFLTVGKTKHDTPEVYEENVEYMDEEQYKEYLKTQNA